MVLTELKSFYRKKKNGVLCPWVKCKNRNLQKDNNFFTFFGWFGLLRKKVKGNTFVFVLKTNKMGSTQVYFNSTSYILG